jgi:radical SAM protein with 4Fe4S-binding SPASM domain
VHPYVARLWNALRGDLPANRLERRLVSDGPGSTSEYDALARKLEWRRGPDETGRFLNVFLEQNNTCNLRCTMCGFSDPRVAAVPRFHMPRDVFDAIAEQLFPATTYLHMSLMTEPFMTPDFPDRLMLVRRYGVPYSRVVTNGTLLTERSIEAILDSEITSLAFSIDGGTPELYEAIRIGSRFDKVLANIDLFRTRRAKRGATFPRLQINHVLMERNVDHAEDFVRLLDLIRPDQVDVRTVHPMAHTGGYETYDPSFFEKVRRVRPLFAECFERNGIEDCGFIRDRAEVIELVRQNGQRMTCRRPWDTLAIHANGDVHPCMSWTRPPVGNLARQSFAEIWAGDILAALREEFERATPGIDCMYCTIKKSVPWSEYDDFFFRMVNKKAESHFTTVSGVRASDPPLPSNEGNGADSRRRIDTRTTDRT